jgi:hypothetical protein
MVHQQPIEIYNKTCGTARIMALTIFILSVFGFCFALYSAKKLSLSLVMLMVGKLVMDMSFIILALISHDIICKQGYEKSLQSAYILFTMGAIVVMLSMGGMSNNTNTR